jgi:hypothetical protein
MIAPGQNRTSSNTKALSAISSTVDFAEILNSLHDEMELALRAARYSNGD